MQKFSTWMILSLAVIFWLLRIAATYTYVMGMDFIVEPLSLELEISLLFIALLAFILLAKRKMLGAIIYIIAYDGYFGVDIFNKFIAMQEGTLASLDYMSIFFSFAGMILPIIALFDLLLDKNRTAHPKDKKTDWFYKDEKFDRQKDERADTNNYRTL